MTYINHQAVEKRLLHKTNEYRPYLKTTFYTKQMSTALT